MKLEIASPEEPQFAMAPMIDMVFLLLVFFMCASHLSQKQNIPLDIPTASKAVVPRERPDRWVVNVQEDGSLFSGSDPVELDQLNTIVTARREQDPNLKVYLRADANAHHKHVKRVMNKLAQAGISDFIFGVFIPSETEGGGQ